MTSALEPGEPVDGSLRWAVRRSFREYMASLPGGIERLGEGAFADPDGRVAFPLSSPKESATYAATGSVTWRGHGGLLVVELRDPRVHLVAGGRSIVSVAPSRGLSAGERRVMAAFFEWDTCDGRVVIPAPRLTVAGVAMFGHVYGVGDVLDPIEISPATVG